MDRAVSKRTSERLENAAREFGAELAMVGPDVRREWVRAAAPNVDPGLLEFALLPGPGPVTPGPGTNHNALMLLTAGSPYITTDDDVITIPARNTGQPPHARDDGPLLSTAHVVIDPTPCENRREVEARVQREDVDVVGSHQALLGQSVSGESLWSADRTVRITLPGSWGDSGLRDSRSLVALDGVAREAGFARYGQLIRSRELVRIPRANIVGTSPALVAMQLGLDNTVPLPPFFTIGRNTDGLFSVMQRLTDPTSVRGFLGFGLLHDPPAPGEASSWHANERRGSSKEVTFLLSPSPADLLMHLAVDNVPAESLIDPAERMRNIGIRLGEAARNVAPLVEQVHTAYALRMSHYLDHLDVLRDHYQGEPAEWSEHIDHIVDGVEDRIADPTALFGPEGCGLEARAFADAAKTYGKLLGIWPDVWQSVLGNARRAGYPT